MKNIFTGAKLTLLGGMILATTLLTTQAGPLTVTPGGIQFPALPNPNPLAGSIIASQTVPFSCPVFSGLLTSTVIQGDTSSPYFGVGGLTFTYQFRIDPGSPHSISQLTVSSFGSFMTDLSFLPQGGQVAPTVASRSNEGGGVGQVVRWTFLQQTVGAGQVSSVLVAQTDSKAYARTLAAIIDGQSVNVASFAPTIVPEPGAIGLMLLGGLAMLLRRKN